MNPLRQEPVMSAAAAALIAALLAKYGLNVSTEDVSLVLGAAVVLFNLIARARVSPVKEPS